MSEIYQKMPGGSFRLINSPVANPPADEANNRTIFYVSPDGNDENDGQSVDKPFEHIGKALELAQRTLGRIDIRLKAASASGVLPLYPLPDNTIWGNLSGSSWPTLYILAWDFAADTLPDDSGQYLMQAALCPKEGNFAYINANISLNGLVLTAPDYGQNGSNDVKTGTSWSGRGIFEIIHCAFVGMIFFKSAVYLYGRLHWLRSGVRDSGIYLIHNSYGIVDSYKGNPSRVTFIGNNVVPIRMGVQSYLNIVPANTALVQSGTFGSKAIMTEGSILNIGANINNLPGTGTSVDASSTII